MCAHQAIGFDIAGAELGFPASRHRRPSTTSPRVHAVTVHAGRGRRARAIRSALLDGRALRLGHGVRLAEDVTVERQDDENTYVSLGPLAQWVRDREIALEQPVLNLQTGAIAAWGKELVDHPFDLLYQLGFRVTVNTDNRLMTDTTLTRELSLLSDAFGYDLDDLEVFQLNAAAAAFLRSRSAKSSRSRSGRIREADPDRPRPAPRPPRTDTQSRPCPSPSTRSSSASRSPLAWRGARRRGRPGAFRRDPADYADRMIAGHRGVRRYVVIAPGLALAHARPGPDVLAGGLASSPSPNRSRSGIPTTTPCTSSSDWRSRAPRSTWNPSPISRMCSMTR